MRKPSPPEPALLFCGMIASSPDRFNDAAAAMTRFYGPVGETSPLFPWEGSDYYAKEIGSPLCRQFIFFKSWIAPDRLADIKRQTIEIEKQLSEPKEDRLCRTVNLDPGYVTPAKVVLATTKNFAHRIYLRDGIFAEVTLVYQRNSFTPFFYTYPDFRSDEYIALFNRVREWLLPRP